MTSRWTDSQLAAIDMLDRDVCVSAGAGSGKTGVLVERFLRIVRRSIAGELPADQAAGVNEILVITFTEKATREMKQRIAASLTRAGLQSQRREVENAFISTIHGFCSRLLKENPFEAGVDPAFTVLEEAESRRMIRAAFESALNDAFQRRDDEIIELASAAQEQRLYGTDVQDPVSALSMATAETIDKLRGAGWREEQLRDLLDGGSDELALRELAAVSNWISPVLTELIDCRARLADYTHGSIGALEAKRRAVLEALTETVERPRSWGELNSTLASVAEARSKLSGSLRPRNSAPPADHEVAEILERVKSLCKELEPLKDFDLEKEARAQTTAFRFLKLVLRTWEFYAEAKYEISALDNDDLPSEAVHLLETSEEVRLRYRRKFKHILVDEFQDTDRLQMRLLRALHDSDSGGPRPNTLFRVGDVQQSIYAFRNAEPAIFQEALAEADLNGGTGLVTLKENFRSRPELLRFVNRIFGWAWRTGSPRFTALEQGSEFDEKPEPSLEVVVAADPGRPLYVDLEARTLTSRIQEIVGRIHITGGRDEAPGRPLKYGDIAVLLRQLTDIERYERAFTLAGIPYFVVGGGRGYYARFEIRDVLNLLTVIDSPLDDLALLSTLRSPFVGLDVDTIYALALFARGEDGKTRQPLYPVIPDFLQSGESERFDRARLGEFYHRIENAAAKEDLIPVGQLLERLVAEFEYDAKLLVRPNGRRRLANLRKLLQMANSMSVHGVADFIRRLREIEKVSEREGDAPTEEEESDVVRLITIHKAKGLEFPVVFLADMGRIPYRPETGIFVCDPVTAAVGSRSDEYRSAAHHAIVRSRHRLEEEESLRLLYVAMTRAEEHLILCGSTPRKQRGSTWADLVFQQIGILAPPEQREVRSFGNEDEILITPFFA